jgi:hypothetical protein
MFIDPNQINPYEVVYGGPGSRLNDDYYSNFLSSIKSKIRKDKIKKLYGLEKTTQNCKR